MTQRELTFDAPITPADVPRMNRQQQAVLEVMRSGSWLTLEQIQLTLAGRGISVTTQTVSARIRDLRKPPLKAIVERKCISPGLFAYRLTPTS